MIWLLYDLYYVYIFLHMREWEAYGADTFDKYWYHLFLYSGFGIWYSPWNLNKPFGIYFIFANRFMPHYGSCTFIIARTSAYVTIIIDKQTHILSILSLTERNKQTQNSTNNETNSSKSQTSKQAETMTNNDDENALKMSLYLDAKRKTMREARHSL